MRHDAGMSTTESAPRYIWFDLEFTDLDPDKAHILQVAVLATDVHLQLLQPDDKGLNLFLKLKDGATISEWVEQNLPDLLAVCRSEHALDAQAAETRITAYLDRIAGPAPDDIRERPVMAGNSVHNDWRLACMHYPALIARLHYRLLDVSTLKQQWQGWLGQPEFDKDDASLVKQYLPFEAGDLEGKPHDAYYDILASIAELNYYRQRLPWSPVAGE